MWPVSTGWRDALTGDLTTTVRASVLYEGAEMWTDDGPEIRDLTVRTWLAGGDKSQICTEATLTIGDETGELWTGRWDSPLGWWGHRLHVHVGAVAGRWSESMPLGRWRVDAIAPKPGTLRELRNGKLVAGPQEVTLTATDMLSQIADERATTPLVPAAGATVRSEIVRLAAGIVPVSDWVAPQSVPASIAYDDHDRLGAILQLASVAGLVPVINRAGALDMIPATGSGDRWIVPMDAQVTIPARGGSRAGVVNGHIVTSESEVQQPLRGQALEGAGPLRWGGPFGRVPGFAHQPVLTTNAACAASAATLQRAAQASRRIELTIEAVADPSVDVLDTAVIETPDRPIEALITAINIGLGPSMVVTATVPLEVLYG